MEQMKYSPPQWVKDEISTKMALVDHPIYLSLKANNFEVDFAHYNRELSKVTKFTLVPISHLEKMSPATYLKYFSNYQIPICLPSVVENKDHIFFHDFLIHCLFSLTLPSKFWNNLENLMEEYKHHPFKLYICVYYWEIASALHTIKEEKKLPLDLEFFEEARSQFIKLQEIAFPPKFFYGLNEEQEKEYRVKTLSYFLREHPYLFEEFGA